MTHTVTTVTTDGHVESVIYTDPTMAVRAVANLEPWTDEDYAAQWNVPAYALVTLSTTN